MGTGTSSSIKDGVFQEILEIDLKINDPICKKIISSSPLPRNLGDYPIFQQIMQKKPNNVKVLVYQSIYSLHRISQTPYQSEIPQSLLISCHNSFLLIERFFDFCVYSWQSWPSPSNFSGSLPTVFFQSASRIIGHPHIQLTVPNTNIYSCIKEEILTAFIIYLLAPKQQIFGSYANHHFFALDQTEPMPFFKLIVRKEKKYIEYFRPLLLICSAGIAFCETWAEALADVPFTDIAPVFDYILHCQITDQSLSLSYTPNPGMYHETLVFLYQVLLHHPDSIESLPNGKQYIVSILLPLQLYNEKKLLSYFHSLALSTLVMLTSEPRLAASLNDPFTGAFPAKSSVHRGSYADLLVEVVTNTVTVADTVPLLPAIACILHNIAPHVHRLSFFSANRVFAFFGQLIESRDRQAPKLVQILVEGFNQVLFSQYSQNSTILMFLVRNVKTFKALQAAGVDVSYILSFVTAFNNKAKSLNIAKLGTDEAERVIKSVDGKKLMEGYTAPGPRGHVFCGEMAELWTDWLKVLASRGGFPELGKSE